MRNLILTFTCLFATQFCNAQSIISSAITPAGTSYKTNNFTLNYAIGETINTFIENGDLYIAQGVLQIIINNTTDLNTIKSPTIKVYPNPTVDNLVVDFNGNNQHLSYQLFNTNGALLSDGNFNKGTSNIDVSNLPTGNYVISILENNQLYKTFKVIKQ